MWAQATQKAHELRRIGCHRPDPWGGLWLPEAHANPGTTLDPQNPNATFTQEGSQTFTLGPVLLLTDQSLSDFVAFFAPDADAAPGTFSSVEFGCRSVEAQSSVEYAAFRSSLVAPLAVETTTWGRMKALYRTDRP